MELKRHHKIIIGSAGSFLLLLVIIGVIVLFVRQNVDYSMLSQKISSLETTTQSQITDLSNNLLDTKNNLKSLGLQVGSIDQDITKLKASVSSDFSGIVESTIKSVVTIKTNVAQGSGFIITSDGYVVTNAHVMEGATAAGIITSDGQTHQVKLIGSNSNMDIALLKIDGTYSPLQLADSDNVQIGEKVIAIGNPLGLQFSVTEGIVSAINRPGQNGINAYIQTDAALNAGNSGGPLVDVNGEAIGINNFKIGGSENLGFALESNYIKQTVNSISQSSLGKNLI
jgi:S1-C subfamily serine protease